MKPLRSEFLYRISLCASLVAFNVAAQAQSVAPVANPRMTVQGSAEQTATPVIKNAFGKPCLDVEAAARSHVMKSNLVDHVVSVKNNCPRAINVTVCYFNSSKCNAFHLSGYGRMDTILGTMTGIRYFRYSIFQK